MACLDLEWLKKTVLVGVDLTDDEGNEYPRELYEMAIKSSLVFITREVGVQYPRLVLADQPYDVVLGDTRRSFMVFTDYAPIRSVEAWKFRQSDYDGITMPDNWIRIRDPDMGWVELWPGKGAPTFQWTSSGMFYIHGRIFDPREPGLIRLDYTAGYDEADLPEDIKYLVALLASYLPLNTAGDLIAGAGIASMSTSMDGISESIGTTSSATNSGYGARIIQNEKSLKMLLPLARAKYRGIQVAVP